MSASGVLDNLMTTLANRIQILDVFAAVERLHDVSADSLRKSAGKAKSTGAPLVFSLSRGPSKPPFRVRDRGVRHT